MFNLGIFCLAIGMIFLLASVGILLDEPLVKLYDKFDAAMENLLDKVLEG